MKPKPPSELKSHIGYWLRAVSNNVSHSFSRKLESSGVTVAEWVVLRELYGREKKTSSSEVATLTGLTRGAVSKLIDRLFNKGFATRTESANDRRYQDISLTKAALELVPKLAAIADQNDEEFFSALNRAERKQLTETLKKLASLHQINHNPIQ